MASLFAQVPICIIRAIINDHDLSSAQVDLPRPSLHWLQVHDLFLYPVLALSSFSPPHFHLFPPRIRAYALPLFVLLRHPFDRFVSLLFPVLLLLLLFLLSLILLILFIFLLLRFFLA